MLHSYSKSWTNPLQCGVCKRDEATHSNQANCDACNYIGSVEFYPSVADLNAMVLCPSCIEKEKAISNSKFQTLTIANEAVKLSIPNAEVIKADINQQYSEHRTVIECRQEFYNNECRAIIELKAKIDLDETIESIEKKRFELARIIQDNIIQYQKALFELSEKQTEITNKMRANIVYFNGVIDALRNNEREQLKMRDATYVPVKIKSVSEPKPKLSKTDKTIQNFADYHKISFDAAKVRLGL